MEKLILGDCLGQLKTLPDESVQCVVTSPPYWGLRDYGHEGQLGLEKTPEGYVANLIEVFREVRRVLRKDGTCWLNLGDSYANTKVGNTETIKNPKVVTSSFKKTIPPNLKVKDLVGIPWRTALALQADGWWLRQDIIWHKPNPMPESVRDRCTKSHEYMFMLTKDKKYYYDNEAIKEPCVEKPHSPGNRVDNGRLTASTGHMKEPERIWAANGKRNKRDVWTINTKPYKGAHFALFPEALVEPCVLAGSKEGDVVMDIFAGSGTTLAVAKRLGRDYLGIELNPEYVPLIEQRLGSVTSHLL